MADEKKKDKKEKKVIKIGTHGRTMGGDRPRFVAPEPPKEGEEAPKTLREKSKDAWKARKERRAKLKAGVRKAARAKGVKLGRWRGSVAFAKDGRKICGVIGSPEVPAGYETIEGGR
jgi:hypothetical protein